MTKKRMTPKQVEKVLADARKAGECIDCKRNTYDIGEYYMVNDWVWQSAGMSPDGGMLCVRDLEKRIGRKLTCRDFFLRPLNVINLSDSTTSKMLMRRMS